MVEARTKLLRFEGKIKDGDVEDYKLNLALTNISAELTSSRLGRNRYRHMTYKTMLKKLQVVWAAGREGISPTKFNDVNSLEEWISFLGIGKRL